MLSYQHGYHAGNAADVHKHVALVQLLGRLRDREKPFCYVDSHAGRGIYDLDDAAARKTREADDGIRRLAALGRPPAAIRTYLDLVAGHNEGGGLRWYPGSPALARASLREQDRAILLEVHPQEVAALRDWARPDRRLSVHARDCFEGLPALLPPPIRRGLVLIDPSYEIKADYEAVARLLSRAFARWSTAVFVLWYPLLAERRHARLLRELGALALPRTLCSEFRFADSGLQGSGLAVVNMPWQLEHELEEAMAFVAAGLRPAGGAFEQRWLTKS